MSPFLTGKCFSRSWTLRSIPSWLAPFRGRRDAHAASPARARRRARSSDARSGRGGPAGSRGAPGGCVAHASSSAYGQRGGEAARLGRVERSGGRPGIAVSRPSRMPVAFELRAARRGAPRCTGARGGRRARATAACSTIWPAYMTATSSAASATTPMSCVMMIIAISCSSRRSLEQVEDLGLDRHVERGRRLVGDQQLRVAGERDGDHHALAHAAGELVRVVVEAPCGVRDADLLEQLDRALAARRPSSCRGGAAASP